MSPARDAGATILVVTRRLDDHAQLIAEELAARDARVVWLDTERCARDPTLVRFGADGTHASALLRAGGGELAGDEVGAVLFRHFHVPTAPHVADGAARDLAESELRGAIEGALLSLDAHWVNPPGANRTARHKLLQLALATREGLTVPETRVSSDPDEIRALHRAWGGRMIAKLVGGQVVAATADEQHLVFTTLLEEDDLREDASLAACPALYQRLVEKAFELRVTVVGDELFACRIDAGHTPDGKVDWRVAGTAGVDLAAHELDADVGRRCIALTRRLGLQVAGIDLIVTPDGETVFLELNAAGGWAWVQRAVGLPIAAAIAENLIAGAQRAPAARPG